MRHTQLGTRTADRKQAVQTPPDENEMIVRYEYFRFETDQLADMLKEIREAKCCGVWGRKKKKGAAVSVGHDLCRKLGISADGVPGISDTGACIISYPVVRISEDERTAFFRIPLKQGESLAVDGLVRESREKGKAWGLG